MTNFEKTLIMEYMNKDSKWTLENIYYYYSNAMNYLIDDYTPNYSEIIRSVVFIVEQIRKES
jgi:hypothetical protein